jgi:hypothetical protein
MGDYVTIAANFEAATTALNPEADARADSSPSALDL